MRKRTIAIIATGFLIGVSGAAFMKHSKPARNPAGATKSKWIPQEASKHLATLKVKIEASEVPKSGDQEVTLTGKITLQQSAQGEVRFQWNLPEGVQVVEGILSDSFPDVKVGQTVVTKLVVSGFNKEDQKLVSLQGSTIASDIQVGASAVVVSKPEETWEAVAPAMQAAAEEQLGTETFRGRRSYQAQ